MATPKIHLMLTRDDGTTLLCCDPGPCGGCREMHCVFITRQGKTICFGCDLKEQKESAAKGAAKAATWGTRL